MLKLKVYESMVDPVNVKKAKKLLRQGVRLIPEAEDWEQEQEITPNTMRNRKQ